MAGNAPFTVNAKIAHSGWKTMTGQSLFESIRQIAPGRWLKIEEDNAAPSPALNASTFQQGSTTKAFAYRLS
jgi:hypothetical protein